MSRLVLLLLILSSSPLWAQDNKPLLESELTPATAAPGEAVTFRVTVLVPTFMPKPIEFPELDQPNLSITTPERSSVPISKNINGESWSGIMRDYRVQALAPGSFTLGGDSVTVTYMDPDTNTPVEVTLPIAPARLTITVPPEAAGLKPFIAANDLTLEQAIDGDNEGIRAGDSFSRTVTATITGSTARQLPQLLNPSAPDGLAAYPQSPEAEDKGDTGTRTEKITYVVEGPTRGELPAVTIRWYDLDDKQVKTAELEPVPVAAKGALPLSRMSLAQWLAVLAAIALSTLVFWRWGIPWVRVQREKARERKAQSAASALASLQSACNNRDYPALVSAVNRWHQLGGDPDNRLNTGLLAIGASRFSAGVHNDNDSAWHEMEKIVDQLKPASTATYSLLPALNP